MRNEQQAQTRRLKFQWKFCKTFRIGTIVHTPFENHFHWRKEGMRKKRCSYLAYRKIFILSLSNYLPVGLA